VGRTATALRRAATVHRLDDADEPVAILVEHEIGVRRAP